MTSIHNNRIFLFPNLTDSNITRRTLEGRYSTDEDGFTFFEFEHTKRTFDRMRIKNLEGYFLMPEELDKQQPDCYKIVSFEFKEKRPKKTICKTIQASLNDVPGYNKQLEDDHNIALTASEAG